MKYSIVQSDKGTSARLGILKTNHSEIQTPVFMPIGTQGAVKTIDPEVLTHLDAQIILSDIMGENKDKVWLKGSDPTGIIKLMNGK